jgi:hypothetical protein
MKERKIVYLEFCTFYSGLEIVDAGRQDARIHTKLEKELMAKWKQSRENRIPYTPESGEFVAEVTKEIKTMGRASSCKKDDHKSLDAINKTSANTVSLECSPI